jgi:hypothetical protein
MTQETPAQLLVEAIYTFERDQPQIDIETNKAMLGNQSLSRFFVPVVDGEVSEAAVLFALLSDIDVHARQALCKVSLCFFGEMAMLDRAMPWLEEPDSPLYQGKLWLRQHAVANRR